MRWTPGDISSDVEDRRGSSGGFGGFGRGPTIGCGGAIILLVLSLLTGKNFFALFDGSGGVPQTGTTETAAPVSESPEERARLEFISDALDDTQNTWTKIFQQEGIQYQRAKLVVFRDLTPSACGTGQAASGPFYCPSDGKVYVDLSFFDELDRRFGAPGDFAQAYVIAHEIGHHVQNLIGTPERRTNEDSVRVELQADCYAGIWAASASQRGILETGDVEEGMGAASAVGDDRMQEMSGRGVNPDAFTHGSAAQRVEWFRRGLESGRIRDCDTFR